MKQKTGKVKIACITLLCVLIASLLALGLAACQDADKGYTAEELAEVVSPYRVYRLKNSWQQLTGAANIDVNSLYCLQSNAFQRAVNTDGKGKFGVDMPFVSLCLSENKLQGFYESDDLYSDWSISYDVGGDCATVAVEIDGNAPDNLQHASIILQKEDAPHYYSLVFTYRFQLDTGGELLLGYRFLGEERYLGLKSAKQDESVTGQYGVYRFDTETYTVVDTTGQGRESGATQLLNAQASEIDLNQLRNTLLPLRYGQFKWSQQGLSWWYVHADGGQEEWAVWSVKSSEWQLQLTQQSGEKTPICDVKVENAAAPHYYRLIVSARVSLADGWELQYTARYLREVRYVTGGDGTQAFPEVAGGYAHTASEIAVAHGEERVYALEIPEAGYYRISTDENLRIKAVYAKNEGGMYNDNRGYRQASGEAVSAVLPAGFCYVRVRNSGEDPVVPTFETELLSINEIRSGDTLTPEAYLTYYRYVVPEGGKLFLQGASFAVFDEWGHEVDLEPKGSATSPTGATVAWVGKGDVLYIGVPTTKDVKNPFVFVASNTETPQYRWCIDDVWYQGEHVRLTWKKYSRHTIKLYRNGTLLSPANLFCLKIDLTQTDGAVWEDGICDVRNADSVWIQYNYDARTNVFVEVEQEDGFDLVIDDTPQGRVWYLHAAHPERYTKVILLVDGIQMEVEIRGTVTEIIPNLWLGLGGYNVRIDKVYDALQGEWRIYQSDSVWSFAGLQ